MIENIVIENFKSIKKVNLDTNRINLFIGESNTGKSNLLEIFGLLSWWGNKTARLNDFIRFQNMSNLFYDDLTDNEIIIKIDKISLRLGYQYDYFRLEDINKEIYINIGHGGEEKGGGMSGGGETIRNKFRIIKFYKYKDLDSFMSGIPMPLEPPYGHNLFSVVYSKKQNRETMKNFVKNFGFFLVFKPQEKIFEIQKQIKDTITSYPYILASDTLKTVIFYLFAIISNRNATLIFEEPEAHAFPYYTRFIAEKIAFDKQNQYFIATHNPYFLSSVLEKAPKKSTNVFITYFEDYQTKLKLLSEEQIREILDFDLDPFFNIRSFYE